MVKTPLGITRRFSIKNIVLQGTVWGSPMCIATTDKLDKKVYDEKEHLYKYKGEVDVPPLEMVDDILTLQNCGLASEAINNQVNNFIEQRKLTLGQKKCVKIHVGKKCNSCDKLNVHEKVMKEANQVKYLGDIVNENGKPKATIVERAYGICAQIFSLLKDIPLGSYRVRIGLELRQSWLINGILFNSEVWHNLNDSDIEQFVEVDKYLLKGLISAHDKTSIEHLNLETAAFPNPSILTSRKLIYLKQILDREEEEITKKIYRCQTKNPVPGD